jgi:ADP-ribose pyrophosphatase YjhB (NUDIX family)
MPRSYPSRPIVGVGAVVWKGDRVLLARRGHPPRQGSWTLPGGAQDVGETVAETARREIREETGLEIDIVDVVAVVDLIERDAAGKVAYHYTVIDMLAEWRSGEAVAADDAEAVAWVHPDELDAYHLSGDALRVIGLASDKRRLLRTAGSGE